MAPSAAAMYIAPATHRPMKAFSTTGITLSKNLFMLLTPCLTAPAAVHELNIVTLSDSVNHNNHDC